MLDHYDDFFLQDEKLGDQFISYKEVDQYISPYQEDCDAREYYCNHVKSLFEVHCPLFSRSSNWQSQITIDSEELKYSSRFKVGMPL